MDALNSGYKTALQRESEAICTLPLGDEAAVTVIGTEAIVRDLDDNCIQQAVNSRLAPGVTDLVLNPDAHLGYGAPVGCVMASPTHIYPGPVGVDIKCSMSLLQTNIDAEAIADRATRRELIRAVCERIPTGPGKGQRSVPKSRHVDERLGFDVVVEGASKNVLRRLGIPAEWAERCEDAYHRGPDGTVDALAERMSQLLRKSVLDKFPVQVQQLGSYGGGNHFGECEVVHVSEDPQMQHIADRFGLLDGKVAFLSHCGSRGFGHTLATRQFQTMKHRFKKAGLAFPGGDPELVYAELGTQEAYDYLCDMALGANFATVNHLLINQLVLEAMQQVLPGARGSLVYFISHNIARRETDPAGREVWVHRKGATRAMPAGHPELAGTPFADTGHPILLPGNPRDGSAVMVARPGAVRSLYSVNHGAGRAMSRRGAKRQLDQSQIDRELEQRDILSNCRFYPRDEAPAAYKDFQEVLRSVQAAGLADPVARLDARCVIKDGSAPDD
ncbi:MAG: RtcB family protein [Planctomycetota bacterium]|nr:MAG: RtcB family protein [Planctomycetota bacterium]